METQVDSGYGSWRLNITVWSFVAIWLALAPWISIGLIFLGALAYSSMKLFGSPDATRLLPGPLILIDIVVEDIKVGVHEGRQRRNRARMLARFGPEIEYF